jgi:hypothetical protein
MIIAMFFVGLFIFCNSFFWSFKNFKANNTLTLFEASYLCVGVFVGSLFMSVTTNLFWRGFPLYKEGVCLKEKDKVGEFTTYSSPYSSLILKVGEESYLTKLFARGELISNESELPISVGNSYESVSMEFCTEKEDK